MPDLDIDLAAADGTRRRLTLPGPRVRIGRDPALELPLASLTVSRLHAELFVAAGGCFVRDHDSAHGTQVNDMRVSSHGPLRPDDRIRIGPFTLQVAERTRRPAVNAAPPGISAAGAVHAAGASAPAHAIPVASTGAGAATPLPDAAPLHWRRVVHDRLLAAFDLRRVDTHRMSDAELRTLTERTLAEIIGGLAELPPAIDRARLAADVRDEAVALGPLEPLLADPGISEIMVNRHDEVFVERGGRLERSPLAFTSDRAVAGIIDRIVAPIGRRIDESSPMVDARLKDGSRVNAVIPPLALKGPSLTIRKFPTRRLLPADLLRFGSASAPMVAFLELAVRHKRNLVISGGTGSGKTTLLNILAGFVPNHERIVTIEDAAELRLPHDNLVSLEARPANLEGKGHVTIRELLRNALRMRPDRIVVGECRGGEALDMLQAMNTGHDGSLTTAHANTPRDLLARLEVMVMMSGMDLPIGAIREQVAASVHLVVQQTRFACGARRITHVCEITGVESGRIQMQDLFRFVPTGFDANGRTTGHFTGCGAVPEFYDALQASGVAVDRSLFAAQEPAGQDRAAHGTAR